MAEKFTSKINSKKYEFNPEFFNFLYHAALEEIERFKVRS
jgi:hypothetical protein